jgi:hypothetical protein
MQSPKDFYPPDWDAISPTFEQEARMHAAPNRSNPPARRRRPRALHFTVRRLKSGCLLYQLERRR